MNEFQKKYLRAQQAPARCSWCLNKFRFNFFLSGTIHKVRTQGKRVGGSTTLLLLSNTFFYCSPGIERQGGPICVLYEWSNFNLNTGVGRIRYEVMNFSRIFLENFNGRKNFLGYLCNLKSRSFNSNQ